MSSVAQRADLLKAELQRVRTVLAGQPSVRQVWVFGSLAAGQTHEWSDVDLMVVEETDLPFLERAVRLSKLLRPQVGMQFLVYTPDELPALSTRPFVWKEILEKGKVLPMNPSSEAARWLTFANEDLRVAELAPNAAVHNQACFHAQQCVEKCLKACLTVSGELLPRTHQIADLIQLLPQTLRAALAQEETGLVALDQFYIPTRYPDALPGMLPEGLPQRHHAEIALRTAQCCYEFAQRTVTG